MNLKNRQTFEAVHRKIRSQWLSSPKPGTYEEQERDFIRRLGEHAAQALNSSTIDGERLAHRLQLEAARRALVLVAPDRTGFEHAPIVDLQWALSDLELGYIRPSLKPPPHTKTPGNKPDNMQTLTFKACCLKAALLLRAAGDAKRKADATVIKQVANAAKRLGLRMTTVPVGTYGEPILHDDGKPRRGTTLDGWRRAHRTRVQMALEKKGTFNVSLETDLDMPPYWPLEGGLSTDDQAAQAQFLGGGEEPTRYPIEGTVGLVLAVKPSGARSWQYWFRETKTEERVWCALGIYPSMTLKQARKEHQKLCRKVANELIAFLKTKHTDMQS